MNEEKALQDLLKSIQVTELKTIDLSGQDKLVVIETPMALTKDLHEKLYRAYLDYFKRNLKVKRLMISESGLKIRIYPNEPERWEKLRNNLKEMCQLDQDPLFQKIEKDIETEDLVMVIIGNYAQMAFKYKKLNEEKKELMQCIERNCPICLSGACHTAECAWGKAIQDILDMPENKSEEKKDVPS